MDSIITDFGRAINAQDGYALSATISPLPPKEDSGRLYALRRATNAYSVLSDFRYAINQNPNFKLDRKEGADWVDVYVAYWKAVSEILAAEESMNQGKTATWDKVYTAWKDLLNALHKGYRNDHFEAWTIPCLYITGKYLRVFAIKADESAASQKGSASFNTAFVDDVVDEEGGNEKLEDCARQINRIFGLCISDRAPLEESRKWGLYYITNLLFKTYFKLNSVSLSKNILRSLTASVSDMPPLSSFPRAHQVTFNYYVGVIHFLDENYSQAEKHLTAAYTQSLASSSHNIKLVLTYLIPARLITASVLPTPALLAPYPGLQKLFGPIATCIKTGDLAGFDRALQAGEDEFVKRRIYLTLERGRDQCMRNLFRKVYLAGGFEAPKEGEPETAEKIRRSRVPIAEFAAALRLGGEEEIPLEEAECLIANLIYKVSAFRNAVSANTNISCQGMMKGYISRSYQLVVMNKKGDAFPGTGV